MGTSRQVSHGCSPEIKSLDVIFIPPDLKDLSLVPEGVVSTLTGGREGTNNTLVL